MLGFGSNLRTLKTAAFWGSACVALQCAKSCFSARFLGFLFAQFHAAFSRAFGAKIQVDSMLVFESNLGKLLCNICVKIMENADQNIGLESGQLFWTLALCGN